MHASSAHCPVGASSAASKPPKRSARTGVLRAAGRAVVALAALAVAASAHAGDPLAGRAKTTECVVCHGQNGLSQMPYAPHLAGQPDIYLAEQLKAYRSGKRVNEVMSVIAKNLSDDDIADIAAWYASIEIRVQPRF